MAQIEEVSFQWKNPDFLIKNPDFLLNNVDFLIEKQISGGPPAQHEIIWTALSKGVVGSWARAAS